MIPYQRSNLQSTDRKGEGSVGLTYENLLYKIIANGAIAFFYEMIFVFFLVKLQQVFQLPELR